MPSADREVQPWVLVLAQGLAVTLVVAVQVWVFWTVYVLLVGGSIPLVGVQVAAGSFSAAVLTFLIGEPVLVFLARLAYLVIIFPLGLTFTRPKPQTPDPQSTEDELLQAQRIDLDLAKDSARKAELEAQRAQERADEAEQAADEAEQAADEAEEDAKEAKERALEAEEWALEVAEEAEREIGGEDWADADAEAAEAEEVARKAKTEARRAEDAALEATEEAGQAREVAREATDRSREANERASQRRTQPNVSEKPKRFRQPGDVWVE